MSFLSALQVDGVFCISVAEREDRRALLEVEFAACNLEIEFYLVQRDENPERGCFNSHKACAAMAIERGYKNVLIMEDDATLEGVKSSSVRRINDFLRCKQPEIFYLGVTLGSMWLTWNFNVVRCRAKGTHAYIFSREACRKLQGFEYFSEPIDRIYSKNFKAYCAFPMVCQQQPEEVSSSDISSGADAEFWKANWRKQYWEVFRNIGKTMIRRDL